MSTCNFLNAKNGIYVLKSIYTNEAYSGVDDPDGIEYEGSQNELIIQLESALKPWGWSISQDKKESEKYLIFDKKFNFAGSLEFKGGYYDGVQVIFSTAQDINNELADNGESRLVNINRHYKNILRLLKKFTICLQVAGVFNNGEAIYAEA